jgi:hypothetical protein
MRKALLPIIFLLVLVSCSATRNIGTNAKTQLWDLSQLSTEELKMANELLTYGLEHEALYTLLDTLKPISSLGYALSFPLAKNSEMKDGDKAVVSLEADSSKMALDELKKWNNVLEALSTEDLKFLLVPFKQTRKGKRNLQILVCRTDKMNSLISSKAHFFGQWGFTANSNLATVLTTIEFESRNDRYRAYGYLFGYPEHAVDFFVSASISEEETGEFVNRNFFSIPVAKGESGHFTYAIPKDYIPDQRDSSIYFQAIHTLNKYNMIKSQYTTESGALDAISLITDYSKSQ